MVYKSVIVQPRVGAARNLSVSADRIDSVASSFASLASWCSTQALGFGGLGFWVLVFWGWVWNLGVGGLGFGVRGSGFGVWGLGIRDWGLGIGVWG